MIFDLIRNGLSFDLLTNLLVRVFAIFCVLPIHEFAHAFMAQKLGDETARLSGRLTLNPLAHVDPMGALMMVVAGFGYAKAVPVNMRNFPIKKRKSYMGLVALAGPVSNLIMAFIFMFFYCLVGFKVGFEDGSVSYYLMQFLSLACSININLAVFNLIPIPPLDGSRILNILIPDKLYYKIMQYERYIVYGIFLLILVGALNKPIDYISSFLTESIFKLASLPFRL